MKAPKTTFVCRECGAVSIKWLGKCPDCASWNSFDEIIAVEEKNNSKPKIAVGKAEKFS